MKLGSRPMTRNDWRLMLTLATALRQAQQRETATVMRLWREEQEEPSPTIHINLAEEEFTR